MKLNDKYFKIKRNEHSVDHEDFTESLFVRCNSSMCVMS